MIAAGIITPDDRVELLDGALIVKMGQNPPHRTAVIRLTRLFSRVPWTRHFVQFGAPITLARSEPEPDGAVIFGSEEQFLDQNPAAEVVRLVVEVADASLGQDRNLKRRLYASAGIPEYWIVDVANHAIEIYRQPIPANADYADVKVCSRDDRIELLIDREAAVQIRVSDIII